MKKYEDLSNVEKDKLKAYLVYKNGVMKYTMTIVTLSYLAVFIGFPLTCLPYLHLFVAGVYLMGIGLFLALVLLYRVRKYEKYTMLSFGIKDVMEDVFEISKEDIKNFKKKVN